MVWEEQYKWVAVPQNGRRGWFDGRGLNFGRREGLLQIKRLALYGCSTRIERCLWWRRWEYQVGGSGNAIN